MPRFNASAFRSDLRMNQAGSRNSNFTCTRWLQRKADAARWALAQGANYLMDWEEDLRLLKPIRVLPDADLITMGNMHNAYMAFTPAGAAKLLSMPASPCSVAMRAVSGSGSSMRPGMATLRGLEVSLRSAAY